MLMIVMEKPMQFTIVSALPFNSGGACKAIMVENWGESAETLMFQKKSTDKNSIGPNRKKSGEHKQQNPENNSAPKATFLLPICCEM